MKKTIVIASNNQGKVREILELTRDLPYQWVSQADFNVPSPEETGTTFVENALIKARFVCEATGLPALADDSGLVVPALNNAPGVYSARYAGPNATSADHIQKLLTVLSENPQVDRAAFFHCALVLLRAPDDPVPMIAEGSWYGSLLDEPRGEHGFGYDPVFFVPMFSKSAAELPSDIKNALSHRGQAMHRLIEKLEEEVHVA